MALSGRNAKEKEMGSSASIWDRVSNLTLNFGLLETFKIQ